MDSLLSLSSIFEQVVTIRLEIGAYVQYLIGSWSSSAGVSYGVALHAHHVIDEITTLQTSSSVSHAVDSDTNYYNHGWQLIKTFSPDLRVVYNLSLGSTDETSHLIDSVDISATLRRRIEGEWLFFSVTPADKRDAEHGFSRDFSLTVQFDAKFGAQY